VASTPTFAHGESERLRGKIELALPELVEASRRLADHPRLDELYPEYLFTIHAVIRASVPLMETARRHAERAADTDPVCAALATYLETHIDEERDHDEWALDDLELLGRDRATVLARTPPASVTTAVGAQYYWILHYHPVVLLGYIRVLEGYPPSPALVDALVDASGHPREAFRTLAAHAELDPRHTEELDALLDELSLTPEQSSALGLNALQSVHLLAQALDEIVGKDS
jgi:hypothetical protein